MNKKQSFDKGYWEGWDIAISSWRLYLNPENWTDQDIEKFEQECYKAEANNHQSADFCYYAQAVDECPNSEGLWESYNDGVNKGIEVVAKAFKRQYKKGHK